MNQRHISKPNLRKKLERLCRELRYVHGKLPPGAEQFGNISCAHHHLTVALRTLDMTPEELQNSNPHNPSAFLP